jgi:hypothetical protein
LKIIAKPKLPIKKSGIFSGVPLEVYHSPDFTPSESVSSSNLRSAWPEGGSLAHMFSEWAHNPNRIQRTDTKWMRFGRAAHHLLLSEEHFSTLFVMEPETYRDTKTAEVKPWSNNAKWCKGWHAEMRQHGRTVLKPAEIAKIHPIVASMKLDPLIQSGGLNGLVEHSLACLDKETGLWLKWRPDVIPNDGDYVDIKLTTSVTDYAVMRSIEDFGYHMQGGLGWEVCDQLGLPFTSFTLLLIESEPPHCIRAVPIEDEDLARGRQQCRAMMRQVRQAIDRGHWPGPGEGEIRAIPLSKRAREDIDIKLQYLSQTGG